MSEWTVAWATAGPPLLRVDECRNEAGRTEYSVVAQNGIPGVVVVARHATSIAFVRQYRRTVGEELLELPRGFGEASDFLPGAGQDAGAGRAAERELAEETGLRLEDAHTVGRIFPDTGLLRGAVDVVAGEVSDLTAGATDGEVSALVWLSPAEVGRLIADGRLCDGISLAALALCLLRPAAGE
ncbi:MAG TPA: NUDIX hydrolase [Nocardioidaceae bacterium]|nr:NUDIX hydrolase [Nocardioidaceae bacterium]